MLLNGAIVPIDGERVFAAFELCSDLIESGVWDLIECESLLLTPKRLLADGGV